MLFIKLHICLYKKSTVAIKPRYFFYLNCQFRLEFSLRSCLFDGYSNCNGHTNHRVVTSTDQTHHLNVSRNGGGTCELCIGVHTAKSISHTIGSRACCHVIRMQGTSCTTTGSNGEVFLTSFDTLFLVGTCYRMLETGRVGGVSGDGNVNVLFPHDSNALTNVVSAVAVYFCTGTIRVSLAEYLFQLAGVVIVLSLNIGETIDTGDDLSSVFSKTVQDNAERFLTYTC